jgi:hypothetical protein
MTEREALKLALELIQDYVDEHGPHDKDSGAQYAITAIKEALMSQSDGAQPEQEYHAVNAVHKGQQCYVKAQPEQEPVADPEKHPHFYTWTWDVMVSGGKWRAEYGWKKPEGYDFANLQPLYTTPPQRKPLTDEEIYDMYNEPRSDAEMLEFARVIEAAHGIIAPTELKGQA